MDEQPDQQNLGRLRWWFWCAFIALALGKLMLVSHEETLVCFEDDLGFANAATCWYWGHAYAPDTHVRQPVYPLFAAISGALGLPLRVSIELAWIGACAVTAAAMRRCGGRSLVVLATCVVILYHPWGLRLNARMLADTLYTPLFLVAMVGLSAALVTAGRGSRSVCTRWGIGAGAAAALAANTRPEMPLMCGLVVLGGVAAVLLWLVGAGDGPTTRNRVVLGCAVPLLMTIGLTHAMRAATFAAIGVYRTSDLVAPGMRSLYNALLAIKPEHHDLRLVISRDVRDRAYEASPAFAKLRDVLEDMQRLRSHAQASEQQTGVKDEYGAWTCWALLEAGWATDANANDGKFSAPRIDALYAQAGAELRLAMQEGRLEHRWAPFSFVAPEWELLWNHLPYAIGDVCDMWVSPLERQMLSEKRMAAAQALFHVAAVRRVVQAAKSEGVQTAHEGWYSPAMTRRLDAIKDGVAGAQGWVSRIEAGAVVLGLGAGLLGLRRGWLRARWAVVMVMTGAGVAARFALVMMMDEAGVPVQRRYLLAGSVLLAVAGAFGAQAVGAALRGAWRDYGLRRAAAGLDSAP